MREFWIGVVLIAAVGGLLLLPSITGLTQGVGDSGLFLFLNAVIVILILILIFLVTRNFWKLVVERRRGILGSHLNLKFVARVRADRARDRPSGLFVVSAFFITQSIDTWFSVQIDRALEESGEVAESLLRVDRDRTRCSTATQIAERIARRRPAARGRTARSSRRSSQAKQREYNLGVVEIFGRRRRASS